jgi:ABC-type Co2+ transport system permease subunit
MRKTFLALCAAAVIAAGTIATPTPSRANGLVVAAIVVGAVVATVFVVHAGMRALHFSGGSIS